MGENPFWTPKCPFFSKLPEKTWVAKSTILHEKIQKVLKSAFPPENFHSGVPSALEKDF